MRVGRATIAWANPGREAPAAAPSAVASNGTARQRATGSPASAKTRLDQAPAAGLEDAAAGKEHRHDGRPSLGEIAGQQLEDGAVEREGDPGAVAGFAVGAERAAMAQRGQSGERQGEHPVARSATGVRHEPDAARIVLIPRVVERHGEGAAAAGSVLASRGHGQVSGDG